MSAKHYETPPDDVIDQYVEVGGVWHLKDSVDFTPRDVLTRQEHYEEMAGVGEESCNCGQRTTNDGLHAKHCRSLLDGVGDVNSDEKGSGARYNTGKPPMNYIPLNQQLLVLMRPSYNLTNRVTDLLLHLARFERGIVSMDSVIRMLTIGDLRESTYVWAYGAEKYAAFNWAKGMKWSIPLACISRHVQEMALGTELDDESGCTHWGHVVCNLLMLQHYELFYKEGDDRPPAEVFQDG